MYRQWAPYVSVAERRRNAAKTAAKMAKKGKAVLPVNIQGRRISTTFWGQAWCRHLEAFSDFSNRLPRGRTYVRSGAVIHLDIVTGKVEALVQGSSLYKVAVTITALEQKKWATIRGICSGQIDSLIELLQGRLSSGVMQSMIDRERGLFPNPKEMRFSCSCPDWASMCKHVAAVLYGVGHRLDHEPALLFKLRGVDHLELMVGARVDPGTAKGKAHVIREGNLSEIFGIDIAVDSRGRSDQTFPRSEKTASHQKKRLTKRKSAAGKMMKNVTKKSGKRPAARHRRRTRP